MKVDVCAFFLPTSVFVSTYSSPCLKVMTSVCFVVQRRELWTLLSKGLLGFFKNPMQRQLQGR